MQRIIDGAKSGSVKLVLPEGEDVRTLLAARELIDSEIADVTLLGDISAIQSTALDSQIDLKGVSIIDPESSEHENEFTDLAFDLLGERGKTREEAGEEVKTAVNFGALMVTSRKADACIAGAVNTSAEVARAALRFIGLKRGVKLLSSSFFMISPDRRKAYTFADCGVVPDPDPKQLAEIAVESAQSHKLLSGEQPKIAFLSFSTRGSAVHAKVEKVTEALEIARRIRPDLEMDGEFQFDSAIDAEVGKRKAPESAVAGEANVLIFPDLDSGNIAYKMAERLGGFTALGPLLQGLKAPVHDLSRGCTSQDIAEVAAIAAFQSIMINVENESIYADV